MPPEDQQQHQPGSSNNISIASDTAMCANPDVRNAVDCIFLANPLCPSKKQKLEEFEKKNPEAAKKLTEGGFAFANFMKDPPPPAKDEFDVDSESEEEKNEFENLIKNLLKTHSQNTLHFEKVEFGIKNFDKIKEEANKDLKMEEAQRLCKKISSIISQTENLSLNMHFFLGKVYNSCLERKVRTQDTLLVNFKVSLRTFHRHIELYKFIEKYPRLLYVPELTYTKILDTKKTCKRAYEEYLAKIKEQREQDKEHKKNVDDVDELSDEMTDVSLNEKKGKGKGRPKKANS